MSCVASNKEGIAATLASTYVLVAFCVGYKISDVPKFTFELLLITSSLVAKDACVAL